MKKLYLLLKIGLFLSLDSFGQSVTLVEGLIITQSTFQEYILGTWEIDKKDNLIDLDDAIDLSSFAIGIKSDKESSKTKDDIILYFQDHGKVDIEDNGQRYNADYIIKDSILQMGNRKYKIHEISKYNLIFEDFGDLAVFKYYYSRSHKKIEPIQQIQTIDEKYPNGQQKIFGLKDSGFHHGIWVEWFDSGKVKTVTYWNNEAPLMKVEFKENGEILSKSWYNLKTASWED